MNTNFQQSYDAVAAEMRQQFDNNVRAMNHRARVDTLRVFGLGTLGAIGGGFAGYTGVDVYRRRNPISKTQNNAIDKLISEFMHSKLAKPVATIFGITNGFGLGAIIGTFTRIFR